MSEMSYAVESWDPGYEHQRLQAVLANDYDVASGDPMTGFELDAREALLQRAEHDIDMAVMYGVAS